MTHNPYLVQCFNSHVNEVIPGTELEERCKKRAESNHLDALVLGPDECPDCVYELNSRDDRMADAVTMFGCPAKDIDGNCPEDCFCKKPMAIQHSPYERQTRGILTFHNAL